ncbi:hypothetical protein EVAR_45547_1 [Eumeta japonica]|uniref:Uncharacterized protein n=1 Tax=Eumeta variegata TaxID=151549 RepID=A0A4C1XAR9_EUMVA|nr:hypothetical protein EVAR_45547_1 [Eumeta japonica]
MSRSVSRSRGRPVAADGCHSPLSASPAPSRREAVSQARSFIVPRLGCALAADCADIGRSCSTVERRNISSGSDVRGEL